MKAIRIFTNDFTYEGKTFPVYTAYYGTCEMNDKGELEFIDFIKRDCSFSKEINTKTLDRAITLINPVEKKEKADNGDYWFLNKTSKDHKTVIKTKTGKPIKKFVIMDLKTLNKDVKWAVSKKNADDELNEFKAYKESQAKAETFAKEVEHYNPKKEIPNSNLDDKLADDQTW